jgi:LysM repeat protein
MIPYGPGAWVGGLTYVVHTGDTMYNIARRFGVTVEDLAAANGIPDLWRVEVGRVLFIPVAAPSAAPSPVTTYIVQPGDTLYSIARRFGLPLEALASANGIPDPQRIFVGQRLVIPCAPPCPEPIVQPMPGFATPNPPSYPAPYPVETPYPPYNPADTPTPITPSPSSNTYLYSSVDGKFSVQYPATWQNGTDNPSGYVVFWSQESTDPFSAGIAVLSKNNPTWRPSQQVLDDYKAALPSLMSGRLGGASFVWDNNPTPVTLSGNLAIADYGYAQVGGANRDRLWAQAVNVGSQDYLALAWAPPDLWSSYQSQLTSLLDTVSFLP